MHYYWFSLIVGLCILQEKTQEGGHGETHYAEFGRADVGNWPTRRLGTQELASDIGTKDGFNGVRNFMLFSVSSGFQPEPSSL